MNKDNQKQLNELHAKNPEKGDYWSEFFIPVCVVLGRVAGAVVICKDKIDIGTNCWNWDWTKIKVMSKTEFKDWLSYKSIPGYWADVSPQHMLDDVLEFEKEET